MSKQYDVTYTTMHITTIVADTPEDAAKIVKASTGRTVEILEVVECSPK